MEFKVIVYYYENGKVRRKEYKVKGTSYDVDMFVDTVENLYFAIATRKGENGEDVLVGEYLLKDLI